MEKFYEIITTSKTGYPIWATVRAHTRAEAETIAQDMAEDLQEEEQSGN